MTDYFALLGEPRRPWLDPEALQKKFLVLAAEAHPDRLPAAPETERQAATARYAELNAATQCLRETKSRLAHLLELELGRKPSGIQTTPADAMELFMKVGQHCRDVDQFLGTRAKATSAMVKAQRFEQGLQWTDRLMSLQQVLRNQQTALDANLRALNAAWEIAPLVGSPARSEHLPLALLEDFYRLTSYYSRCRNQLQERLVQLSL